MANSDFEFDEFFDQMNSEEDTSTTTDTRNTSTTHTTSNTQQPFSVRLDQEYVEVIKALAWWKRISQRELIEETIDGILSEMDSEELKKVISKYQSQK